MSKKIPKVVLKILNIGFIVFLLLYLYSCILQLIACKNTVLQNFFGIDNIYCQGESYDVLIGLTYYFGFILLAYFVCILVLKWFLKGK